MQIYQHTAVTALQQGQQIIIRSSKGKVSAKHVVLAGNVYLSEIAPQLAPKLAKRIMPVATYIIATEPIDTKIAKQLIPKNAAVCDTNFDLDYFRLSAPTQIRPAHHLWRAN